MQMIVFLVVGGVLLIYGVATIILHSCFYWCKSPFLSTSSGEFNEDHLNTIQADAYFQRGNLFYNKGMFDAAIKNYTEAIKRDSSLPLAEKHPQYALLRKPAPTFSLENDENNPNSEQYPLSFLGTSSTANDRSAKKDSLTDDSKNDEIYVIDAQEDILVPEIVEAATQDIELAVCTNAENNSAEPFSSEPDADLDFSSETKETSSAINLPQALEQVFVQGMLELNNKNEAQALIAFDSVIKNLPTHADSYFQRGNIHFNNKRFENAIADYSTAIKYNPSHGKAYCMRGKANIQRNLYIDAITDFNMAIDIMPNDIDAYLNRGQANAQRAQRNEAISDFSKVIDLNPDNEIAYYSRGLEWQNLGEEDKAVADLVKACNLGHNAACVAYINIQKSQKNRTDR